MANQWPSTCHYRSTPDISIAGWPMFETTARDLCPPEAAEHFAMLAGRIAESLELGVARARGLLLRKGERLKSD